MTKKLLSVLVATLLCLFPLSAQTALLSSTITLDLKNTDVVEALKILSRQGKFNLLVGQNVKGRVTLCLHETPLDQAFHMLLESCNLAWIQKAETFEVLTPPEYESKTGIPWKGNQKRLPIPLRFAAATDLTASLQKLLPQVLLVADERSNTLWAQGSEDLLKQVQTIVSEMDVETVNGAFPFLYLEPKQVEEMLKLFLGKNGAYTVNAGARQAFFKGSPENVRSLLSLLEKQDLPPKCQTKVYDLRYSKFDVLEGKLKPLLTPDLGKIVVDERSNKIIVTDLEIRFPEIDRVVSECDVKDREVLIEARIVQVTLSDRFRFGINWQTVLEQVGQSQLGLRLISAPEATEKFVAGADFAESLQAIHKTSDIAVPSKDTRSTTLTDTAENSFAKNTLTEKSLHSVNTVRTLTDTNERTSSDRLPFNQKIDALEGGARLIASGSLDGHSFEGVLNALKALGDTKVLSSPRLITLNNVEAKIQVASKEAYVTSTIVTPGSGPATTAENVTFIDVGVSLSVTPQINSDGYITMKVKPSVSSVTSSVTTASGNRIPIVSTQEVESKVQVKDGVTILLGGLREQFTDKTESRIPFLGAIPVLGNLFKKISREVRNSELIMFLTPRIITGEQSFFEEEAKAGAFQSENRSAKS